MVEFGVGNGEKGAETKNGPFFSLNSPLNLAPPVPARCRGTSLIRKHTLLGTYRRPVHRVLCRSYGGGRFLIREVPL